MFKNVFAMQFIGSSFLVVCLTMDDGGGKCLDERRKV